MAAAAALIVPTACQGAISPQNQVGSQATPTPLSAVVPGTSGQTASPAGTAPASSGSTGSPAATAPTTSGPVASPTVIAPSAAATPVPSTSGSTSSGQVVGSSPAATAAAAKPTGTAATTGSASWPWGSPILQDTFDGSSLDLSKWRVYDSPNANPFPRASDRASVANGMLKLTGGYDSLGRDVSGGIASKLDQMYGRWEMRFRVEQGTGYSGVGLLWPKTERWPVDGEVDFVEVVNGDREDYIATVHTGAENHMETGEIQGSFDNWHTAAVEWLPNRITVILDGSPVWTMQRGRAPSGASLIPVNSPMHLALQLDRGCYQSLPCRIAQTPSRVSMYVDGVKIWKAPASLLDL